MTTRTNKTAFLGIHGTYSDMACQAAFPGGQTIPCASFEDAFDAVSSGEADTAMIPIDNTLAGRVADVHNLLPRSDLHIIDEHFQPVCHALMGTKDAEISDIQHVHSHVHAIPQCRKIIREHKFESHVHADTASAAKYISDIQDKTHAAIASPLSAEIYGLKILAENVQDDNKNTTRFVILSKTPDVPDFVEGDLFITSFFFTVRNIPASLYKCMGGFATNNVNMVKLESYVDKNFQAAQFYCDVEGHPDETSLKLAMEELGFFAKEVRILGTYKAHPFRHEA